MFVRKICTFNVNEIDYSLDPECEFLKMRIKSQIVFHNYNLSVVPVPDGVPVRSGVCQKEEEPAHIFTSGQEKYL